MSPKENDTDPSTPAARVAVKPAGPAPTQPITPAKILAVAPAAAPPARASAQGSGTDPGVAPAAPRSAPGADTDPDPGPGIGAPPTPVAVPVPHAARKAAEAARKAQPGKNDSIDALLDGIAGPQPERTKKTPQSRGEAAAAYQVEHRVLPGQPMPPPQPSVIVDKPKLPPTLKLERAKIDAAIAAQRAEMEHTAPPSERPVTRAGDATVVTPRKQGPRIVVALFAGVLVVFAIFVAIKMWSVGVKKDAMATDPTASALVKGPIPQFGAKPTPTATASATATASVEPVATATATTIATATATATATAPAAATAPATTARPAIPDLKTDFKH